MSQISTDAKDEGTVQQYIDERPAWADGTPSPSSPLTGVQRRIWWLAAAGKFFSKAVSCSSPELRCR
jgi:MFS transporter, putative metabolite transport protein